MPGQKKNEVIIEISNKIVVGYSTKYGQLEKLFIGKHYEQL